MSKESYKGMYLQEIRARQALDEIGGHAPIIIDHKTPKTTVGCVDFTLLFPTSMLMYNRIDREKDIDVFFMGLITPKRKIFIDLFPASLAQYTIIINSNYGRIDGVREWDQNYFDYMSRSKFVLCPDGDFTWTYRFFEAVIFKAIPVVEHDCDIYEGYNYYHAGDELVYRLDWVESNLNKVIKEMML